MIPWERKIRTICIKVSLHCDCKLRKFQSGTKLMKPEWCQQFSTWCEKLVDIPIWNRDKSPSREVGTGEGGGRGDRLPLRFWQVPKPYLNQGRGADYAHHIATPRPPDIQTFLWPCLQLWPKPRSSLAHAQWVDIVSKVPFFFHAFDTSKMA